MPTSNSEARKRAEEDRPKPIDALVALFRRNPPQAKLYGGRVFVSGSLLKEESYLGLDAKRHLKDGTPVEPLTTWNPKRVLCDDCGRLEFEAHRSGCPRMVVATPREYALERHRKESGRPFSDPERNEFVERFAAGLRGL